MESNGNGMGIEWGFIIISSSDLCTELPVVPWMTWVILLVASGAF